MSRRFSTLHNYTVVRFTAAYNSVGFDEKDYAGIRQDTMKMDAFIGSTPRAWTTAPPEAATVPVTVIGVRP